MLRDEEWKMGVIRYKEGKECRESERKVMFSFNLKWGKTVGAGTVCVCVCVYTLL
jgi:hypothetical protein